MGCGARFVGLMFFWVFDVFGVLVVVAGLVWAAGVLSIR